MLTAPTPDQAVGLRSWFVPDRPGPLVGLHVLNTGHGRCYVDRWPDPRVVLADTGRNYTLVGDPSTLAPDDLRDTIVTGFVEASAEFEPLLYATFPALKLMPRVILDAPLQVPVPPAMDALVRPLVPNDTHAIGSMDPSLAWISRTWTDPAGLAASGHAWGAFLADELVAVACSFFVGDRYEDIGVVTQPTHRGRGLSTACAASLCGDIYRRGRRPSWTTTPDNQASLRVAARLGFRMQRTDRLLVVGGPPS